MKILFADNDKNFQNMLSSVFKEEGFSVFLASDGKEALETAEEETPDIVILDLILPKKDGFSVIKDLNANPRLSRIPVVVLTDLEENKHIERALSSGAYTYLIKSDHTIDEIIRKVKQIKEHKRL
jgi:two-component system alkaline phosphatase synthesis response regulator PhoP